LPVQVRFCAEACGAIEISSPAARSSELDKKGSRKVEDSWSFCVFVGLGTVYLFNFGKNALSRLPFCFRKLPFHTAGLQWRKSTGKGNFSMDAARGGYRPVWKLANLASIY
jgi:hypothetical protein